MTARFRGFALRRSTLAAVALASMIALVGSLGFYGTFDSWTFLRPGLLAAGTCFVIGVFAVYRNLLFGEALLVSTVGLVLAGVPATQLTVSGQAFQNFAQALFDSWAELLSQTPPADLSTRSAVVPFVAVWFGSFVAVELARRPALPGLPVLGGLFTMGIAILFSTENRTLAIVQSAFLLVSLLAVAQLQQRIAEDTRVVDAALTSGGKPARGQALLFGIGMLALAAGLSTVLGPRLPLANANERFDLRDELDPAFDPLREPSPLVTIKASLKQTDDVVDFVVTGDQPAERFTVAVLDSYDGVVWTVADALGQGAAQFVPVGRNLPDVTHPPTGGGAAYTIEVVGLRGPWIPHTGTPLSVRFDNPGDVRMNVATGTLARAQHLVEGETIEITSIETPQPAVSTLRDRRYGRDSVSTALSAAAPTLADRVQQIVKDIEFDASADPRGAQIVALQEALTDERSALYTTGLAVEPGHSWNALTEFLGGPNGVLLGYEEQYAAAAGVLGRILNMPTRVVVGYELPARRWEGGRAEVRANDRRAWIEVLTNDAGWIAVHVTPERTEAPEDIEETVGEKRPIAPATDPLPPPIAVPDDQLDPIEDEPEESTGGEEPEELEEPEEANENVFLAWLVTPLGLAVVSGSSLALLVGLSIALILLLKGRRTERRRNADAENDRIVGAWAELNDRLTEIGVDMPRNLTPRQQAYQLGVIEDLDPVSNLIIDLADDVDIAMYRDEPATIEEALRAWERSDEATSHALKNLDRLDRARIRIDPRPLLRSRS